MMLVKIDSTLLVHSFSEIQKVNQEVYLLIHYALHIADES